MCKPIRFSSRSPCLICESEIEIVQLPSLRIILKEGVPSTRWGCIPSSCTMIRSTCKFLWILAIEISRDKYITVNIIFKTSSYLWSFCPTRLPSMGWLLCYHIRTTVEFMPLPSFEIMKPSVVTRVISTPMPKWEIVRCPERGDPGSMILEMERLPNTRYKAPSAPRHTCC